MLCILYANKFSMTRIRNSETKLQCQSDNVTLFAKNRTVIRDHLNRLKSDLSKYPIINVPLQEWRTKS